MKNKNLLKYFAEIRGVSQAQINSILKNNVKNNSKNKIYELNYFLLFNNNNSIIYDIYSKENDLLLLAKILQLKLFFCLNTENNMDNDNYLSLINSDIELDKFRECIKKLKENKDDLKYNELISIYKYISVFLFFWHKAFKYPQLISYKKINFELNDILNLFPLFNNILIETLNKFVFNNKQISMDKYDTVRNIYPYSVY